MKAVSITIGILAHVDAGKTTLAEHILYRAGVVRKPGRVDHQDAFLDTYALEKERGITIFSKQANLTLGDKQVTLLDTPGHVDFSAEMERTLQVLDYAVLLISAADGVTGHVYTLWRLLRRYRIPVLIFVNKMDQQGADAARVFAELKSKLSEDCVDLSGAAPADQDGAAPDAAPEAFAASLDEAALEAMAGTDEAAMDEYLEGGALSRESIARLVSERKVFPCFFGSALKGDGVARFLTGLAALTEYPDCPEAFAARVFKIAREGAARLTYVKILGGALKVKQTVAAGEKVDQIRLYNGASYQLLSEAPAGCVCALTGPEQTRAGEGLGTLREATLPVLESVLNYSVILPEKEDVHRAYTNLKQLEEELPELHVYYRQEEALLSPLLTTGEGAEGGNALPAGLKNSGIGVRVMGEVQIEILKRLLSERYGLAVRFGAGQIVYRETITDTVEGVGHYEPLRHYAEVHLLLEPGERGSGIVFESRCHTDDLDLNWQRLIETHVLERIHRGVLTGSELTDVHVVLAAGRAHLKHTEGGDFREATYRAIRQGLMQAKSILLEPVYTFRLELPMACVGRAISDIQAMNGTFAGPDADSRDPELAVLTGTAPAAGMLGYQSALSSYTRGEGRLSLTYKGYEPCRDQEAILAVSAYDPDADSANPSGSVFCSHGAGMFIPWYEVKAYMHLPSMLPGEEAYPEADGEAPGESAGPGGGGSQGRSAAAYGRQIPGDIPDDGELMKIFERTYGEIKKGRAGWKKSRRFDSEAAPAPRAGAKAPKKPLLLVDGYNVIHAWPKLRALAEESLDAARVSLMDILANYRGYRQMTLILVFDAYKVTGGEGELYAYHGIHVVYTKEAETADTYIEKTVHELAKEFDITVATSDAAEQVIIWGEGARRMSARELADEIRSAGEEMSRDYLGKESGRLGGMFRELPPKLQALLEDMRLGREQEQA